MRHVDGVVVRVRQQPLRSLVLVNSLHLEDQMNRLAVC